MHDGVKPIDYYPGIFDKYKMYSNLDKWTDLEFAETMWGLGFDMDCFESFDVYLKKCSLKVKEAKTSRQEKRNLLYLLEHAERTIVGNYLFSYWRWLTHWLMYGYDDYEVDFVRRIIRILEDKYPKNLEQKTIDDYVKSIHFPEMKLCYEEGTYAYYIVKNPLEGDNGVPNMVFEDRHINTFEVCDSDVVFEVLDKINNENNNVENQTKHKEKEMCVVIKPSATQCKKCIYAYEDTKYTVGAEKANCEIYVSPYDKPKGVLWEDEICPYKEEFMTIDEYTKSIDFPKMKLLGETSDFRYYDELETESDNDEGIPIVVVENKKTNKFDIIDGEDALNALSLFSN